MARRRAGASRAAARHGAAAFRRLVDLNADAEGLHPAIAFAARIGRVAAGSSAGADLADWAATQAEKAGAAEALRARLSALEGLPGRVLGEEHPAIAAALARQRANCDVDPMPL